MNDKTWEKDEVFVFGSNERGIHGAGAAKFAVAHCGAILRQGAGRQGNSYAIPTCSMPGKPLPLDEIRMYVNAFLTYVEFGAIANEKFFLTRIGCGFAGYSDKDIAPMFKDAPKNVRRPEGW